MKKILITFITCVMSSTLMANNITCNSFGTTSICRDSYGNSRTTHQIGDSYITHGNDGYRSTTHHIGNDTYQGRDNRGNTWNMNMSNNNRYNWLED